MADILPSTGTYKVSAKVNGINIDNCSLVSSKDKIVPFFEEAVSSDPDITALVVFLKDSRGEVTGVKVTYKLDEDFIGLKDFDETEEEEENSEVKDEQDNLADKEESKPTSEEEKKTSAANEAAASSTASVAATEVADLEGTSDKELPDKELPIEEIYKNGDELVFTVKSLDKKLPFYPLAADLPMDHYTIVYQIMGEKQILQKIEKTFFYLADMAFSFKNIQIHFPGVAENTLLIPKGTVIMLDVKLDYNNQLDPYIVWYNGKTIISEGKFTDGAGSILWQSPDQSGFFSLRAEVFPVLNRYGLSGYSRDVSLLVSSNTPEIHLLSYDMPGLKHWYIFDGSLNDAASASDESALKPKEKVLPKWAPADEIYALAVSQGDCYSLKEIPFSIEEANDWQILFRFKPVEKGEYFNVHFGSASDVYMVLSADDKNLILTLSSSVGNVSQEIVLPPTEQFITAAIDFSILPEQLSAKLFFMDNKTKAKPIKLDVEINKEFKIMLGNSVKKTDEKAAEEKAEKAVQKPVLLALWDEFAVINQPLVEEKTDDAENEPPEMVELVEPIIESALEI